MTDRELIEREELLEDILDALEDGDYEEAEDLADEAIEEFPKEAFGYYYLGEAQFFQGDLHEAIYYYGQAIERAPDNPDYKARLALMHAKLGEDQQAKQVYQSVLQQHDAHAASLVALGVYAANANEPQEALTYLDRAVESNPDYEDAYEVRAIVHTNLGDTQAALKDVNKALEYKPNRSELWQQKIDLLDQLGNTDDTAAAFEQWIAQSPEEPRRYHAYGEFLANNDRHADAENAYSLAIENQIYGHLPALRSFLGRGWARLHQGKYVDAVEDFNRVVELEPKIADAYIGLAEARDRQGELEAALVHLDVGLDVVLDQHWLLLNKKGVLLTQHKAWEAAKAAFTAITELDDEEAQAEGYYSLGKWHQAQGDLEQAFRHWRKASDIFHLEADQAIDLYCSEFLEQELKEKEIALLGDLQEKFEENRQSKLLQPLLDQFWTVDLEATQKNNKLLAQLPAKFGKLLLKTLGNLCLTLTHRGMLVAVPGQDGVRLVYTIEEETKQQVVVAGVPLNGAQRREFTLIPRGKHLVMQGFGDDDGDIDLYLQPTEGSQLSKHIKAVFQKLKDADELSYLGSDFNAPV